MQNYQIEMERELAEIRKSGLRPLLVLHACCAPCSSAVLEKLSEDFRIIVFFYNPNIAPEAEFARRADEEERLVREMGLADVRVARGEYDAAAFYAAVRGHEGDPEGGARCGICFEQRLAATARYAAQVGADYFTTSLSISPLKDARRLNEIGAAAAAKYGVKYLYSDFKKKNGYARSLELSRQYGLYRQDYCGCVFSKREAEDRRAARLDMDALRAGLKPNDIGWTIEYHDEIDSTNTRAKALAAAGAAHGTLVLADRQTAGRGRFARPFYSPEHAGVYMSVILRPEIAPERAVMITSMAAVAVARAMERTAGVHAAIKWINDVYLNEKKACGILCEACLDAQRGGLDYVVMGIGVNVGRMQFPPELEETATSLGNACGRAVSRTDFLAALLAELNALWPKLDSEEILRESRERSMVLGRDVLVLRGDERFWARAVAIEADGSLTVETPDGRRISLHSGEVSLKIRPGA